MRSAKRGCNRRVVLFVSVALGILGTKCSDRHQASHLGDTYSEILTGMHRPVTTIGKMWQKRRSLAIQVRLARTRTC